MKSSDFYLLDCASTKGIGYLTLTGKDKAVSPRTIMNYLAGRAVPPHPIEMRLKGSRPGDFLIGELSIFVTDHIIELFKNEKVTGWKTYPLRVVNQKPKAISGYHGLQITGRVGPLTATAKKKGKIDFKISTWDGSDLFVPEDTWFTIAHPRVISLLEKNKIKGAVWEPLPDVCC